MSSRITTVKDFYDLYISEINYVFREMHRKNWFKCYFWDTESVLQFEILESVFGDRYWNSFVVMPEVAGVKMSDILTELIDNHIDVDELCQTAMSTYIESGAGSARWSCKRPVHQEFENYSIGH